MEYYTECDPSSCKWWKLEAESFCNVLNVLADASQCIFTLACAGALRSSFIQREGRICYSHLITLIGYGPRLTLRVSTHILHTPPLPRARNILGLVHTTVVCEPLQRYQCNSYENSFCDKNSHDHYGHRYVSVPFNCILVFGQRKNSVKSDLPDVWYRFSLCCKSLDFALSSS